jgi:hypothetical protein
MAGISVVDDWISRLAAAGHDLSCSGGTIGKSAILHASSADMEWAKQNAVHSHEAEIGVRAASQFRMFGLTPVPATPRNQASGEGPCWNARSGRHQTVSGLKPAD